MAVLDANEIMFTAFEPKVQNRFIMYIDGIPSYLIKKASAPGFEAGEPHVITISTAKCGHLDTVLKTLAHEIIHMICYLESPKTDKYTSHKGLFLKLQKRVANTLGYDPKELYSIW